MDREPLALQREDWIQASWTVIATQSVDAVKIEALARHLGVSKGSFYWHFKNRADLLGALLQYWEKDTERIIQASQQAPSAAECLLRLFDLIAQTSHQFSADTAIFLWAEKNSQVAQRVRTVEERRIGYIKKMLCQCGFSDREAAHRAEVAYLAFLGYAGRRSRDDTFGLSLNEFNRFLLSMLLAPTPATALESSWSEAEFYQQMAHDN